MGQSRPLLVYVHPFQRTQININWKSIHGVLGTWTWGGRMEGADECAELWRHPVPNHIVSLDFKKSWRSDIQVYCCSFRHFKTKSHWPSYIDSSYLTRFISSQKSPGQICQIDSLWHNILSNLVWQRYLGLRKLTRKYTLADSNLHRPYGKKYRDRRGAVTFQFQVDLTQQLNPLYSFWTVKMLKCVERCSFVMFLWHISSLACKDRRRRRRRRRTLRGSAATVKKKKKEEDLLTYWPNILISFVPLREAMLLL